MGIKASGRLALIVAAGIWIWFSGPLQAQQSTAQTQAATSQPVALGKPIALNKYAKRHSRHGRRHARSHSRRHHRVAKSEKSETKSSKRTDETETKKSEAQKSEALDAKVIESKSVALPPTDAQTSDSKAADNKTADSNAGDTNQATPPAANQAIAAQPDQGTNQGTNNGNASATLSSSVANARAQLLSTTTTGNASTMTPPPAPANPQTALNAGASAPSDNAANTDVVPPDQLNDIDRSLNNNKEPPPTIAMASINTQPSTETAAVANNDASPWAQTSMIGKIFIAFGGLLTLASAARMLIA